MDVSKNQLQEALKIYHDYWESYIKGNLEGFAFTLDEAFEMIGTSENEVCHNKAEGLEFYKAQMSEVVGKVEMRNRSIAAKPLDGMILINESCDIYVLGEPEWTLYSKLRLSTLLHETASGWKVIQQHGSLPDIRVQEGETIALEKITRENLELRDAVKRRTVELEQKNRELEIEASLERVRSVAMGMKKPEDMLDVCRVISDQLKGFGVGNIRNVQTAIIDEEMGIYLCYQYFTPYEKVAVERTEYLKSPVEEGMVRQMLASRNGHFTGTLTGKELVEFREHRKAEQHFPDPLLDEAEELSHCFLSIGKGGLGLTLYQAMDAATLDLFRRFHQVFSLAYQRFRDIEMAESRAREVEIDLALERVRAQTMAMHSSKDVGKCIVKMFAELTALGVDEGTRFGIGILNHENENNQLWTARKDGEEIKMHIGNLDMASHPLLKSARKAWKDQVPIHKYVLVGEDLLDYYRMLNTAPDYKIQIPIEKLPKKEIQHCFIFEHGFFYAFSPHEFQPDLIQITKRFSSQFAQTYRRYLDLVKAEAQAREAQIQLALERVRARTMAMHKSSELIETAELLFDQLRILGADSLGVAFAICEPDNVMVTKWTSIGIFSVPYTSEGGEKRMYEAWLNQSEIYEEVYEGEKLMKYYQLFLEIPEFKAGFQKMIESGLPMPIWQKNHAVPFTHGYLLLITYKPFDETNIFIRFGKVFDQTYTRFLDLQRAEAQAREAQIEAALEKIRSRSLAMHHSNELREVISIFFEKLIELEVLLGTVAIQLFDQQGMPSIFWVGNSIQDPQNVHLPYDAVIKLEDNYLGDGWKAMSEQKEIINKVYSKSQKDRFFEHLFDHNDLTQIPENAREMLRNMDSHVICLFPSKNSGLFVDSWDGRLYPSDDLQILRRAGKVFEQAYIRFLDLQKAEAQAKEAQIQLALERVRARTMAMQKSEELAEVSYLLNKQVVELGIPTRGCAFNIYGENESTEWFSNLEGTLPTYKTPRENIFLKYYEAGQRGETLMIEEFGKERIKQHYDYLHSLHLLGNDEEVVEKIRNAMPDFQIDHVAYFKYGYLLFITLVPAPEAHDIFKRFAKEFEQTYTRFLDLKKAEEQVREAQIEAALERVRSRSMGMQRGEDLKGVVKELYDQLRSLGFQWGVASITIMDADTGDIDWWMEGFDDGYDLPEKYHVPNFDNKGHKQQIEHWKNGSNYAVIEITGLEKKAYDAYYFYQTDFVKAPENSKKLMMSQETVTFSMAYMKYGALSWSPPKLDENQAIVLQRFAKVFEQTYTRFLDLQKAEAQAREAEIEVALEKVRSRSLAMHKSDELKDVVFSVFERLRDLQIQTDSTSIAIYHDESAKMELWAANDMNYASKFSLPMTGRFYPLEGIEARKEQKAFLEHFSFEEKNRYWKELFETPDFQKVPEARKNYLLEKTDCLIQLAAFGKVTGILLIRHFNNPFSDADIEITERFAKVFDQAYTRFLDLQKAEEQAREAQIQLSLERIRSKAMAMQHSDELSDFLTVVFEQFEVLNLNPVNCHLNFLDIENNRNTFRLTGKRGATLIATQEIDLDASPHWKKRVEDWKAGHPNDVDVSYTPSENQHEVSEIFKEILSKLPEEDRPLPEDFPDGLYVIDGYCKNGYLGYSSSKPPTEEEKEITRRIANEFGNVYQRFLDLEKAEAQAKEATKQASLDRVRGVISGMRSAGDLDLITPLVFNELTILGVPFIRCGVFIIHEKEEIVEAYLSSPDGHSLGALKLPFRASELTYQSVEAWRKGEVYRQHWNKEDFVRWIEELMKQDQIQDSRTYQGSAAPPESLDLHFVPFTQGMLYVGSIAPLGEEEIDLVKALAQAFAIAYARYEDFVKLDKAKAGIEHALNELKSTQAQLVQQEKLASLGQLTAGIAHEIKNPLNFVNNFSEVSIEMIDEALEERAKSQDARDETLVDEILEDIKSNLKKVHEHGSRANSILTSMLQHSRGGSGKKEPTDLNALIREYSNLAFHGMRAGKNPINVKIDLELDDQIKEVPLIGEDFSRVILNLSNNAFDAMREKWMKTGDGRPKTGEAQEDKVNYLPKLTVSTRLEGDKVRLSFEDNGPGIPDDIKNKILQPFFTTKKGTEGTGLGLSITNDIVKAHGGELRLETKVGEFTQFNVVLPLK